MRLTFTPDAFAPGYALYLAAILIPGYGVGEYFGIWSKVDGVTQRLGMAFAYGLAVETVAFAIRTLGRIGPVTLAGASVDDLYVIIDVDVE